MLLFIIGCALSHGLPIIRVTFRVKFLLLTGAVPNCKQRVLSKSRGVSRPAPGGFSGFGMSRRWDGRDPGMVRDTGIRLKMSVMTQNTRYNTGTIQVFQCFSTVRVQRHNSGSSRFSREEERRERERIPAGNSRIPIPKSRPGHISMAF